MGASLRARLGLALGLRLLRRRRRWGGIELVDWQAFGFRQRYLPREARIRGLLLLRLEVLLRLLRRALVVIVVGLSGLLLLRRLRLRVLAARVHGGASKQM